MNKPFNLQEQQLDDQLSEFTDQVLSNKSEEDMQEIMAQGELAELQKAVLLMKSATKKARTSGDADARIRKRLIMEWKNIRQAERPAPKRFTWNWNMPRRALAGGFAVLILISVVTLLTPTEAPLTATSGGSQTWSPFVILAGIIIIVFILWHNRHD